MCRWSATYHWKAFDKSYNFTTNVTLIEGLHTKLWTSKVAKIPISRISILQLESPKTKCMLALWPGTKNTIKGKVMASLKSGPWWILWIHVSSVHQKCSNYALTNSVFGLCKSVWVIDLFVIFSSFHPGTPAWPFTPKCCERGKVSQLLIFLLFTLWTHNWIHKRVWRCVNHPLLSNALIFYDEYGLIIHLNYLQRTLKRGVIDFFLSFLIK